MIALKPYTAYVGPTPREKEIVSFIRGFIRARHYPPSIRQIGKALGLASPSTVHNHLHRLEQKGIITREPFQDRTIVLVEDWQ